ncbi:MAG TPA: aminopeptidase P family N-terminal domain-containing protein, partial [Rhodoferax sp.]|nr:aminopeptidase P family N-terminal domain-containing protein [Rhodoferax sp.]
MTATLSVFAQRIASAQAALKDLGLAACLVPSSDPHLSEYLPARWQGREWLSGFTGSMGTLTLTPSRAALFADSRYWTQAETELAGSGIELVKIETGAATHHVQWLASNVATGQSVGVDGAVLGLAAAQQLREALSKVGATLRTDVDLFAHIWPDRAGLPQAPVYEHDAAFVGAPRSTKLAQVRDAMVHVKASHHFISTVDDIAWLFNLRGSDVSYNPVFLAHALVDMQAATLFVAEGKVPADVATRLHSDGVAVRDYAQAAAALAALPA